MGDAALTQHLKLKAFEVCPIEYNLHDAWDNTAFPGNGSKLGSHDVLGIFSMSMY